MINCKINRQTSVDLPTYNDNVYTWMDGSYLSVLDNPYVTSTLFHCEERWICIIRTQPCPQKICEVTGLKNLEHSKLIKIYSEFSSLESGAILLEMVTGVHGNTVRIISSKDGSIPIYFCHSKDLIYFNWDFKKIAATRKSLNLDFEYLVKSTFEPNYTYRTAFQGIAMLTAGASCTFSAESCAYKFANPDPYAVQTTQLIESDEATYEFSALLKKKIKLQLKDPDKIAIELSGGLDSSTIAIACALAFPSSNRNTYGIMVSDPLPAESQRNRRNEIISRIYGRDYEVKITDHLPSLSSFAQDRFYLNSEAYGDAFDSVWSRAASDGQHIIFNGCGGDELFPQFLDEDFSGDRLRSINDHTWGLYNQLLMCRLTPRVQDILSSSLIP